ncbi:MAG: hypothetical protein ABI261_06610, partial [Ginsengibacter sp.]
MNKNFILVTFIFFMSVNLLSAQQLYMPRNITKAFENGTRSLDGSPGKNYWQNEGKYDINETVNPETKIVSGV